MPAPASSLPPTSAGDALLVADVGNSRIKLAVVAEGHAGRPLPSIEKRCAVATGSFHPAAVEQWLHAVAPGPAAIVVASVHDAAAARLEGVIAAVSATRDRPLRQRRITPADMPLTIVLPEPQRVGIDRLAAAAAAARLKPAGRPAIVVDCGSAATVDVVSAEGRFLGGAILPGPSLMARALAAGTSRLPEVAAFAGEGMPAMPGRSTQEAIAAGIGWGMLGALARVVEEARRSVAGPAEPWVILTGGWRAAVRDALPGAEDAPDLVLQGIALAAGWAREG